jgi:hypothetical protein
MFTKKVSNVLLAVFDMAPALDDFGMVGLDEGRGEAKG